MNGCVTISSRSMALKMPGSVLLCIRTLHGLHILTLLINRRHTFQCTQLYHYLLIFCVICLIFRAFKSDYTHEDSVHFKHEIWPLIHFYRKVGQFFLLVEWIHGDIHMDRVCRASIMGLPGGVGVLYVTYLTFTRTNVLTCISMSIYPDIQSESEHSMIYCI